MWNIDVQPPACCDVHFKCLECEYLAILRKTTVNTDSSIFRMSDSSFLRYIPQVIRPLRFNLVISPHGRSGWDGCSRRCHCSRSRGYRTLQYVQYIVDGCRVCQVNAWFDRNFTRFTQITLDLRPLCFETLTYLK